MQQTIKSNESGLLLSFWTFNHPELLNDLEATSVISRKKLINIINYKHFMDGVLYALLRHPVYDACIIIPVQPQNCIEDTLTCRGDKSLLSLKLDKYQFKYLLIMNDPDVTVVPVAAMQTENGIYLFQLPLKSYAANKRYCRRITCDIAQAGLMQDGFIAYGSLVDFSPSAFRIKINPDSAKSLQWFNPDSSTTISLVRNNQIIFTGRCRLIRQEYTRGGLEIVLEPLESTINRFQKRILRNPRRQITPRLTASFEHPFIKKTIQRGIVDLSSSGFSIEDEIGEEVLMPGMILPSLHISNAGGFDVVCKAQVIYRNNREQSVKYGIVILDMDIHDYTSLANLLNGISHPNVSISAKIDIDELWELFFDTGFIYPRKYGFVQGYKNDLKKTCQRLYEENPEIIRHVTFQKNGRIYGHISMIRIYERTWMMHHHAARPVDGRITGLLVWKQLLYYISDFVRLPSARADYILGYFQPTNRFTDRIYADFDREMDNPQKVSRDIFSYLYYENDDQTTTLPEGWSIAECTELELWQMKLFYKHRSGGLFINALNPDEDKQGYESVEKTYSRLGYIRQIKYYGLSCNEKLCAVFILEASDIGLNISELSNGIKIMILDEEAVSWDVLTAAISHSAMIHNMQRMAVLIYPDSYLDTRGIKNDKKYCMWILDSKYTNTYLEYLERKLKIKI